MDKAECARLMHTIKELTDKVTKLEPDVAHPKNQVNRLEGRV